MSSASGSPAGPGRSHHAAGRKGDLFWGASGEAAGAPGPSERRRGGGWQRNLRAESKGDRAEELLCQPRLFSRRLPPSSPASSVMIPPLKGSERRSRKSLSCSHNFQGQDEPKVGGATHALFFGRGALRVCLFRNHTN